MASVYARNSANLITYSILCVCVCLSNAFSLWHALNATHTFRLHDVTVRFTPPRTPTRVYSLFLARVVLRETRSIFPN